MDYGTKKKVKDVAKEFAGKDKIKVKKFVRFKVGEGIYNLCLQKKY